MRRCFGPCTVVLFLVLWSLPAYAQDTRGPIEVGLQVTGVHLHKIDETPLGFGARIFIDLHRRLGLDAEVDHFPGNPSGNFGETSALFGIRSGVRGSRFGAFVKARAGVMHFGGAYFDQRFERKTIADVDLGAILEYYPSPRTTIRVDAGDTILFYGSQSIRPNPSSLPLGTVHNFQPAFGFGFRF